MQALLAKLPGLTTPVWLFLWLGLACLTLALLVLMWTRWGQSRPLRKCVALSLLAHLLMAGFATTVDVGRPGQVQRTGDSFSVSLVEDGDAASTGESGQTLAGTEGEFWEELPATTPEPAVAEAAPIADPFQPGTEHLPLAAAAVIAPVATAEAPAPAAAAPELTPEPTKLAEAPLAPAAEVEPAPTPEAAVASVPGPSPDDVPPPPAAEPSPAPHLAQVADVPPPENVAEEPLTALPTTTLPELSASLAEALPQPSPATAADWASDRDAADPGPQPIDPAPGPFSVSRGSGAAGSAALGAAAAGSSSVAIPGEGPSIGPNPATPASAGGAFAGGPNPYQLRTSPGRAALVERQGGSAATEQAVESALRWLAAAQSPDGRWDADRFGAGHETQVQGRDRGRAGADADTGLTGLALLAFLGAGHTHQRGPYQETVQRGLDFLLRSQADNGSLGGQSQIYAMMYSHGMASLALGEAYAMTQDVRLRLALENAVGYTLSAQHPSEGGWRYRPGERGDTSQLGWQLMALRSAESSGVAVPPRTKRLMVRFLKSVSYGDHGGLAAYRPGERTTRPMTAEALVCRQFLGMARANPASDEAGDYLMAELPGQGLSNLYYWYYGTLGAYQLQGDHWQRWNEALRAELTRTQRQDGELAGSWDVDQMWGSYGGRVFSTALGAMCLEVYYRYLPLYAQTPGQSVQMR